MTAGIMLIWLNDMLYSPSLCVCEREDSLAAVDFSIGICVDKEVVPWQYHRIDLIMLSTRTDTTTVSSVLRKRHLQTMFLKACRKSAEKRP